MGGRARTVPHQAAGTRRKNLSTNSRDFARAVGPNREEGKSQKEKRFQVRRGKKPSFFR